MKIELPQLGEGVRRGKRTRKGAMGRTSNKSEHLIYTMAKPEITHTINSFTYQWGAFCLQIASVSSKHS
jgi:hypothetical protein